MKKFIKPNWKKSNLNISATLAEFLGAPNNNKTLKILKNELAKGYKNVVFICLDGMGMYPIKKHLSKDSLLRKNIKMVLRSTFPSTTTNATTSLTSNKLPLQHGWFGWTLHFDVVDRNIDLYKNRDSQTGEQIEFKYPIFDNSICYFDNVNSEYEINPILPIYVKTQIENKKIVIENESDLVNSIKQVCLRPGKQFVYAYLSQPDATMHDFGVSSDQANQKIKSISNEIEKLYSDLTDTLIIITADHGQIDVAGCVDFYKDKEINDMLLCTPFLDARTPAFKVKTGKEKEFKKLFKSRYGKDFKLFKTIDLIRRGYFGESGDYGYLLGDYIAIGTYTHKLFISYENMTSFKGHHTSLTEEMLVPLIILKS